MSCTTYQALCPGLDPSTASTCKPPMFSACAGMHRMGLVALCTAPHYARTGGRGAVHQRSPSPSRGALPQDRSTPAAPASRAAIAAEVDKSGHKSRDKRTAGLKPRCLHSRTRLDRTARLAPRCPPRYDHTHQYDSASRHVHCLRILSPASPRLALCRIADPIPTTSCSDTHPCAIRSCRRGSCTHNTSVLSRSPCAVHAARRSRSAM